MSDRSGWSGLHKLSDRRYALVIDNALVPSYVRTESGDYSYRYYDTEGHRKAALKQLRLPEGSYSLYEGEIVWWEQSAQTSDRLGPESS
jgi:hypothetical protein